MKLSALAFAKINLYLKVLDKREDGLHNLDMVMQSVSLADKVSVETTGLGGITVACDGADIEDNIAKTAAVAYFGRAKMQIQGLKITIEKNIPLSAGLAGGSADAAAVLAICNKMYGRLEDAQLLELAGEIGSDVPFCLTGGTKRVKGFGDEISDLKLNCDYRLVLIKCGNKRSTGHMYSLIDGSDVHIDADADELCRYLEMGDMSACRCMQNDFMRLWDDAVSMEVCDDLIGSGADAVSLSGSGPTFFGVFGNKNSAQMCYDKLKEKYDEIFICDPAECGIKIIE